MQDHYWVVGEDRDRVWSSAAGGYVPRDAPAFAARLEALGPALAFTRIASEAELWDVLASQAPDRLPNLPAAQDVLKGKRLAAIDVLQFRIHLDHENRLRALEGKPALTAAQFRTALAS